MSEPLTRKRKRIIALAVAAWVLVLVSGNGLLYAYSLAPGEQAAAPTGWPGQSRVARDRERHTLVLIAHPRCPCTRATIAELARLMTELEGRLAARVLFLRPTGAPDAWEKTDLYTSAARIPGVVVLDDPGGVETARFGAKTSGQALLYAADGRLLFAGGITASRGHEGDNVGRARVVSLVTQSKADRALSAVFGCPLEDGATSFLLPRFRFIDSIKERQ
jgi:hypothetical protein